MRHIQRLILLSFILSMGLAACGTPAAEQGTQATVTPNVPTITPEPTTETDPAFAFESGVSGIGEIKAAQSAELIFAVVGTVATVEVQEGDIIKEGDLLATLDMRPFDQQIRQAEATLTNAQAQSASLYEGPRAAEVTAAQSQIQSAQATLDQIYAGPKAEDLTTAETNVDQAQTQLQSTRDQLSLAKTQAEAQVTQATEALKIAQASYAQAKSNWEFVQDTGQNPQQPVLGVDPEGNEIESDVVDAQRESYYAQFVRAEAALRQAEQTVRDAVVAAEEARKAEIVGIESAEHGVVQAQASLDKLLRPPDADVVAGTEAQIAGARAQLDTLTAPPRASAQAQATAAITQAAVALDSAKLSREQAELRAPFDGVVATINIDPGDPSAAGGVPALTIVDVSSLHVDVQISDVDIENVQVDQKATVSVEAVSRGIFSGTVSYVAPTATVEGPIRTYLVRVTLDEMEGLRPGMRARVELIDDDV
ncbi:MAG: HlyD family efflux transporter periplasmic adaptor subunit [Chloroflexota bacterium]